MNKSVGTILAAALASFALAGAAAAQTALSAQDRSDMQRIESYLQGLSTVRARFIQQSELGGFAAGTFYLARPGQMRIEYDPPVPYLYVADGSWLTFWDEELGQRTDVPIGSTLADFITREDVSLEGDVTVTGIRRVSELDEIEVDLVQTDDPGSGQLTLVFDDDPLAFKRWTVRDGQGLFTEVTLTEPAYGIALTDDLFRAPRPRRRERDD
ncbi:MAG: outer membrane lipoprotein carrier protein LolA [Inquilinus sp.]|nr:outer membrane lipoprotein carrier protein LolA [Inquilinus sp.]